METLEEHFRVKSLRRRRHSQLRSTRFAMLCMLLTLCATIAMLWAINTP